MKIRRITTLMFVLAIAPLIVGLSACDQIGQLLVPAPPQMEELDGEIPVGVVLSITGRFASTFGRPMGTGFELALEEINNSQLGGRSIKFIIEDDQSTVEGAVEAFNKLIQQDGVPVILGPATSTQTKAAFPIATRKWGRGVKLHLRRSRSERDWRFCLSCRSHHRCADSERSLRQLLQNSATKQQQRCMMKTMSSPQIAMRQSGKSSLQTTSRC